MRLEARPIGVGESDLILGLKLIRALLDDFAIGMKPCDRLSGTGGQREAAQLRALTHRPLSELDIDELERLWAAAKRSLQARSS